MFQLSKEEVAALRSQIATSNAGRGGRRYAPYVFTEQGVAMLSGVLRSKRAVAVNIEIMRAFVELRRVASSYAALENRLERIEREMTERLVLEFGPGVRWQISSADAPVSSRS
jgi:hypothetical protein